MHAMVGALRGFSSTNRREEAYLVGHHTRGAEIYMSKLRRTHACLSTTAAAPPPSTRGNRRATDPPRCRGRSSAR